MSRFELSANLAKMSLFVRILAHPDMDGPTRRRRLEVPQLDGSASPSVLANENNGRQSANESPQLSSATNYRNSSFGDVVSSFVDGRGHRCDESEFKRGRSNKNRSKKMQFVA